jgi:hypothetical protein
MYTELPPKETSTLFARQKGRWTNMSSPSPSRDLPTPRKQIEILVVESNPADTRLTEEAFRAAGLTSGFRSVSDGEDALAYVRKEGRYVNVATPDLIFRFQRSPGLRF